MDAIDRATGYVAGMDIAAFESDPRTQDAVLHSIQIIGEAANKIRMLDPQFATKHPEILRDADVDYSWKPVPEPAIAEAKL